jgi:hypothetical protein
VANIDLIRIRIKSLGGAQYSVAVDDSSQQIIVSWTPANTYSDAMSQLFDRDDPSRPRTIAEQDDIGSIVGETLFDTFIAGHIRQRYDACKAAASKERDAGAAPRVCLHIPRDLFAHPWELLRDPRELRGQFIALRGSVTRYDADLDTTDAPIVAQSLTRVDETVVFILSDPQAQPIGPVTPPTKLKRFKIRHVKPASFKKFSIALKTRRPSSIVFFGHGKIVDKVGALVFTKDEFFGRFKKPVDDLKQGFAVASAIGVDPAVDIALVLACEGAWMQEGMSFENTVAGALLMRTWLRFVAAAQDRINVNAMLAFFEATISALSENMPPDLAVASGRLAVYNLDPQSAGSRALLDWWIPVLYAREPDLTFRAEHPYTEAVTPLPRRHHDAASAASFGALGEAVSAARDLVSDLFRPASGVRSRI